MIDSIRNAHINANADNAIKATQQNANKGRKQNDKAKTILEKSAIDAVKNPVPSKPESMIDHQHKAIETADFIKVEMLKVVDQHIKAGKNAQIFKAYFMNKSNARIQLITSLGYDFDKALNINGTLTGSQLENRKAKLIRAIQKDYLYSLATLFTSFVKEPTLKKLNNIREYDSGNNGIFKVILKPELSAVLFNKEMDFDKIMLSLPPFLNVNFVESLTNKAKLDKKDNNPPLKTTAPMINVNDFNHIFNFIKNDADADTLATMQEIIAEKLAIFKAKTQAENIAKKERKVEAQAKIKVKNVSAKKTTAVKKYAAQLRRLTFIPTVFKVAPFSLTKAFDVGYVFPHEVVTGLKNIMLSQAVLELSAA